MVGAHERLFSEAAAWGFTAAASGQFPSTGPKCGALHPSRASRAAQDLAGGLRLVFAGSTGDGKAFAEDFALPWSYKVDEICVMCQASKCAGPMNFLNPRWDAPWASTQRTLEQYLDIVVGQPCDYKDL